MTTEAIYSRFGIPTLGFRNYWYPVIETRKLGTRPLSAQVLGENIVLFRESGKLFALEDRCPHRGAKLSLGKCQFPGSGTISCPYHGWTFNGATGELVAKLMEGPDGVTDKVRIKRYPVEERCGLVFVFVGDMAAPPVEEDFPEFMADPDKFFSIPMHTDYKCNWRVLVDNWGQEEHGPYVHASSPELIFQPYLPFAHKTVSEELPGKKGLGYIQVGGTNSANYPGLGVFPRKTWYRFLKPAGRGKWEDNVESPAFKLYGIRYLLELRLPCVVVIGRQHGEYNLVQWAVPLDDGSVRLFNINCFRRKGALHKFFVWLDYVSWRGWAHDRLFSNQDKRMVESVTPGLERLSRSDVGVIAWRKFANANARRPPEPPRLVENM